MCTMDSRRLQEVHIHSLLQVYTKSGPDGKPLEGGEPCIPIRQLATGGDPSGDHRIWCQVGGDQPQCWNVLE